MKQSILHGIIAACLLLAASAGPTAAQQIRPDKTFFLTPRIGTSAYLGDNSTAFFGDAFDVKGKFPIYAGLEFGYQSSPSVSLSTAYQLGNYPLMNRGGSALSLLENHPTIRHTIQLFGRYTLGAARSPVAPYLMGGFHTTFGTTKVFGTATEESRTAYGPVLGLGMDIALNRQLSLFLEGQTNLSFPDEAVDGRKGGRFGSFDMLAGISSGLKVNFKSAVVPVEIHSIDGPVALEVGQQATYTAVTNEDRATRPVTYTWNWGDGSAATGMTASHTYASAGTYTVTFRAANPGRKADSSITVRVTDIPASIVSMEADPKTPDTRSAVRFRASVHGTAPLSYSWQFGDGTISTEVSPSHTFGTEGTHDVELTVTNRAGSDTRNLALTVRTYEAEICSEISEMSSVFFDRNASMLTAAAKSTLSDNLEILRECPNMNVRIEGFAAPGERNPQRLSEDRTRSVEQFYVAGGISVARLQMIGRGPVAGMTSKKDGAGRHQRVDSIPLRPPGSRADASRQ